MRVLAGSLSSPRPRKVSNKRGLWQRVVTLIAVEGTTKSRTSTAKNRAPTLYAIIAVKLLKGLLFVGLAFVAYALSDNDLPF